MSGLLSLVKTLFVPALISLVLYLSLSFVILPFIRRHRQRYSQYLPLDRLSTHTTSLRERAADALMSFLLPSSWRSRREIDAAFDGNGSVYDDDEGENMVGFEVNAGRREALERDRALARPDTTRRLSRELEQGFMDDSEDDEEDQRIGNSRSAV